jgi:metal-sulfur cluster biosynthetic enzyme
MPTDGVAERDGSAGAVSHEQILDALKSIPEPCSIAMRTPMDITEMGLIEEVAIEGECVRVVLVLTDPSCVHFNAMASFIRDAVGALDGVGTVDVGMSTATLWTPDRVQHRRKPIGA